MVNCFANVFFIADLIFFFIKYFKSFLKKLFQAPVKERVKIVRKAESFKDDREQLHGENGTSAIHSKLAARDFLSKQLSFMAADNVNCLPLGTRPVERSQSVKLLASKFETKPTVEVKENASGGLNSLLRNKGDSVSSYNKRNSTGGNMLKSASTIVETDQVLPSMRVARTHSLKLSPYGDGGSLSHVAPIGSLAHSYNEREMRLFSGSDSDLSRSAGARYTSSWKEREALIGNQKIRPFLKQQDSKNTIVGNHNRNHVNTGGIFLKQVDSKIVDNHDENHIKTGEISVKRNITTKRASSLRHSAPFFTDVPQVERSSSLKMGTTPYFEEGEVKLRRYGSLRNPPSPQREEETNVTEINANLQQEPVCNGSTSLVSSSIGDNTDELNGSVNSMDFGNEKVDHPEVSSSWEERRAQRKVMRMSTSNPYDLIGDEKQLNEMVSYLNVPWFLKALFLMKMPHILFL